MNKSILLFALTSTTFFGCAPAPLTGEDVLADCTPGDLGCECIADIACEVGLVCISGVCVFPDGDGDVPGDGDGDVGDGDLGDGDGDGDMPPGDGDTGEPGDGDGTIGPGGDGDGDGDGDGTGGDGDTGDGDGALELIGEVPREPLFVPTFEAISHTGELRTSDYLIGTPTVLWFFPDALTGGTTTEGLGFRDRQAAFDALGVTIVGVSFETQQENSIFANNEAFAFELWSDINKELADYYDANGGNAAARKTVILNAGGVLVLEYPSVPTVGTHAADVLSDCEKLF